MKWHTVVVGLPKNMNNTIGPRGEASQAYGDLIRIKSLVPSSYLG